MQLNEDIFYTRNRLVRLVSDTRLVYKVYQVNQISEMLMEILEIYPPLFAST